MPPKLALAHPIQDPALQRGKGAATSNRGRGNGGPSRQPLEKPKRAQVAVACSYCRQKKLKCDALRPCTVCVTRELVCQYDAKQGETIMQAVKRKHNETTDKLEMYEELFHMIEICDHSAVAQIVRWIRSGQDPQAIVEHVKADSPIEGPDALQIFLINLAHSTGSLRQILGLAVSVSTPTTSARIPNPTAFKALCNRIVLFSDMENMLYPVPQPRRVLSLFRGAAEPQAYGAQHRIALQSESFEEDIHMPHSHLCLVPARPWTTLIADDDAVSHLVSLFLVWINPTWRFVEADIFLLGMRSKSIDSDLCSPFLVNSILAIASLHSEHDIAFSDSRRDRIARGQHFHDEAMRLWALEQNRPSLTNMQALCVLALESNYRAKDTLGLTLVPIAAGFDNTIPMHKDAESCESLGISQRDYSRVRLNAHWMIECTHVIMRIAFMSDAVAEPSRPVFPRIYDVFDDQVEVWTGYPLTSSDTTHRPTLYLRERCRLAEIFKDVHALILTRTKSCDSTVQGFTNTVEDTLAKMRHWYQRLPFELQYRWPISVAIWELHASYLSVSMILLSQARTRLQQHEISPKGQLPLTEYSAEDAHLKSRMCQDFLSQAITLSHESAQILKEFRERYGLKITPAWLLQLQAVTVGILVLDPELTDPATVMSSTAAELETTIRDSPTAFDEVFRSLLGAGVEVMIARAIARMSYHTAQKKNIVLSRSTWNMLQVMSGTAWRPSDVNLVNSTFPNFATFKTYEDQTERMTEFLSKLEAIEI